MIIVRKPLNESNGPGVSAGRKIGSEALAQMLTAAGQVPGAGGSYADLNFLRDEIAAFLSISSLELET